MRELLRAVEKLRDETIRNGNHNWDAGFEILIAFLKEKLFDVDVFSEPIILETKTILHRLEDFEYPCLNDEQYDKLGDRVVDYYKFYGSTPHIKNPDLKR